MVECPSCKSDFERVSSHWSASAECDYPEITDRQYEILTGLLMGDGYCISVSGSGKNANPRFNSKMITPEFLEWVDEEMGALGLGVGLYMTPEESADRNRRRGWRPNADPKNYSNVYIWKSRPHPSFTWFRDWYSTGQKRFPDNLELTPLILKVWYCCDGGIYKGKNSANPYLYISADNELDREEFLVGLFEDIPVSPRIYDRITFRVDDSKYLWDWTEGPLPGFEYKWPEGF